jgi:hypothetical protein
MYEKIKTFKDFRVLQYTKLEKHSIPQPGTIYSIVRNKFVLLPNLFLHGFEFRRFVSSDHLYCGEVISLPDLRNIVGIDALPGEILWLLRLRCWYRRGLLLLLLSCSLPSRTVWRRRIFVLCVFRAFIVVVGFQQRRRLSRNRNIRDTRRNGGSL